VVVQTRTDSSLSTVSTYSWREDKPWGSLLDHAAYLRLHRWIDSLAKRRLHAEIIREPGGLILRLAGRLDSRSSQILKEGLQEIVKFGPVSFELDLGEVSRIDGVGLAAIVWAKQLVEGRGGQLKIVRLNHRLGRSWLE